MIICINSVVLEQSVFKMIIFVLQFIASATLIASSCAAVPLRNFPTSAEGNNLQLAYQTLGISRVEQSQRERPQERNFEEIQYRLRANQQYDEEYEQEQIRRPVTTTHIHSLVGTNDDTRLVQSGGSFILSDDAHIQGLLRSQLEQRQQQEQQLQLQQLQVQQAQLNRQRSHIPERREEELPVGRRGPLYALVQNEEFQHPAAFQRSQAATTQDQARIEAHPRQKPAQVIVNENFQRQRAQEIQQRTEEDEYIQSRSIQKAVKELTQQHGNHLNTKPLSRPNSKQIEQTENEYSLARAEQVHRFGNAESQRRQEQEAREQHEQQVQRQLILQQQLHEHHRQQVLQLQELDRREKTRRFNQIQTLDEQRNVLTVRPTQISRAAVNNAAAELQEGRSGPKFDLVDYEKSENRGTSERVFPDYSVEERLVQQRPISIRQQALSNPIQDRRVPVNTGSVSAVPSVTAEVAQATADHFNFYNSVAKNLPVLSLEETDPEAAAILRARHGAGLRHDGVFVIQDS